MHGPPSEPAVVQLEGGMVVVGTVGTVVAMEEQGSIVWHRLALLHNGRGQGETMLMLLARPSVDMPVTLSKGGVRYWPRMELVHSVHAEYSLAQWNVTSRAPQASCDACGHTPAQRDGSALLASVKLDPCPSGEVGREVSLHGHAEGRCRVSMEVGLLAQGRAARQATLPHNKVFDVLCYALATLMEGAQLPEGHVVGGSASSTGDGRDRARDTLRRYPTCWSACRQSFTHGLSLGYPPWTCLPCGLLLHSPCMRWLQCAWTSCAGYSGAQISIHRRSRRVGILSFANSLTHSR
jgi:hypothetical protein